MKTQYGRVELLIPQRFRARAATATALLALCTMTVAGCALTTEHIVLSYKPQAGAAKLVGADRIGVRVHVKDQRTSKDVAFKMNGLGMEMAPIIVDDDIPALVKNAIESELKDRGFQIAPGPVLVEAAIGRFRNHFEIGFFSGTAAADLEMNVTVAAPDHRVMFNKLIVAQGINPNIQLATGENAQIALDAALKNAIARLFDDPDFTKALLTAGEHAG